MQLHLLTILIARRRSRWSVIRRDTFNSNGIMERNSAGNSFRTTIVFLLPICGFSDPRKSPVAINFNPLSSRPSLSPSYTYIHISVYTYIRIPNLFSYPRVPRIEPKTLRESNVELRESNEVFTRTTAVLSRSVPLLLGNWSCVSATHEFRPFERLFRPRTNDTRRVCLPSNRNSFLPPAPTTHQIAHRLATDRTPTLSPSRTHDRPS